MLDPKKIRKESINFKPKRWIEKADIYSGIYFSEYYCDLSHFYKKVTWPYYLPDRKSWFMKIFTEWDMQNQKDILLIENDKPQKPIFKLNIIYDVLKLGKFNNSSL